MERIRPRPAIFITEKADDLLVVHLGEGLHGAAFREDGGDLLGDANVVEQPEVEVAGLHELEGLIHITESAVARALPALGRKEDLIAAVLQDARPIYCSLHRSGIPYLGAVSIRLTPRSRARSMRGTATSQLLGC